MSSKIYSGEIRPGFRILIMGESYKNPQIIFWRKRSAPASLESTIFEISPNPNFPPDNITLCVNEDYILERVVKISDNPRSYNCYTYLLDHSSDNWREDLRNLSETEPRPCECLQKMAVDIRLASASKWVFAPSHDWQKGVAEIEFQMLSEQNTIKSIKIPAKYCPLCGKKYQGHV